MREYLTTVEAGLKVRVGRILHEHALGLVRVEGHLRRLGAHQLDKLRCILVLLPVTCGEIMVGVGGVWVEPLVLLRGEVGASGGH